MAATAPLGLGLAALGRPAYVNVGHGDDVGHGPDVATLESQAHAVLDEAWTLGIRHFDVARSYGLAERFLGSWLARDPGRRGGLTIGSKWGYTYVADWQVDVEDFPAFIVVDDKGNDFFAETAKPVALTIRTRSAES